MIDIVEADLSLPTHADALIQLMNAYALDPMGGGQGLSNYVKANLPGELAKRKSVHVILAFVDAQPAGLVVCLASVREAPRSAVRRTSYGRGRAGFNLVCFDSQYTFLIRFDWWENNRSYTDRCLLVCHLPELKDKPEFYGQKKQLPIIKQDLVSVSWSGELLDFNSVPSQTLQEVCKRVKLAFDKYVAGDKNGKRSGKPRFKNQARFRSMIFEGVKLHSCSVGGNFLYLSMPKLGLIKIRHHRYLPNGAILKSVQIIKKVDGWYINLRLQDDTVPDFKSDIVSTWENSIGMDAVLHENDYLATSEGIKLPSLKSFRHSLNKLAKVSKRKAVKKKGSKARRKLAKKEAKIHQQIARSRKDHAYNTAHALLKTGKQVFFHEKLNLTGLRRKNQPKQDELGHYLPNGQCRKAGLNLSWADAAFGQFFEILKFKAEKAGALVIPVNPQYTSMLLPYKDEFVFTDCGIREYWDIELKLLIDRDIAAGINIKRVGLDLFPTIKRRKGNPVVVASATNSTLKEVLTALRGFQKPALYA